MTANTLLLIGQKHQTLERENRRLTRELEVAKALLFRIDRRREGNLRVAKSMRLNWTPVDASDTALNAIKQDDKAFSDWLANSTASVFNDQAYCARREQDLSDYILNEAEKTVSDQDRVYQQVQDAKWARHDKLKG